MPPLNKGGNDVGTVTYCTSTGIMKHAHRMQKKKKKKYKKIETLIVADCT